MASEFELARQITDSQQRVYGYIYSLVGNSAAAWDILQETNLVIWRKRDEAAKVSNFDAWAFTIARFQVMAYLRDKQRDPLVVLTPDLLEGFSEEAEQVACEMTGRIEALRKCRQRLSDKSGHLLELYYENGLSLSEISTRLGTNPNALKQALHRVRRSLFACIEGLLPGSTS